MKWKFFRRNKKKSGGIYEDKFDKREWFIFQVNSTLLGLGIPVVMRADKVGDLALKLLNAANEYDPSFMTNLKEYLDKQELKEE